MATHNARSLLTMGTFMMSRRPTYLTLPTMAAAIALAGCNRLPPNGENETMSLLRAGSEKVCVAPDVQNTLKGLILPKPTDLSSDTTAEDKQSAIGAVTLSYDLTTLQSFDKAVSRASCSTTVQLSGAEGKSDKFAVSYQVSPSAENASSFIVTADTDAAKSFAGGMIAEAVATAVAKREADQQDKQASEQHGKLMAVISPRWLVGTWISTSDNAAACANGEGMSFQANQVYEGLLFAGRWSLTGDQLHRVGSGAQGGSDETDTITEADAISFTLTKSNGGSTSYRRCTHAETTTINPPPGSDTETSQ